MERVRYDLKRRGKEGEKGKGRGVQAGVRCYYTAVASLLSPTALLSFAPTHTSDPAGDGVTLEQACESVSAETQDPLTPVCQVPPTCLKQGIWLHSECYVGQEVRHRSVPGRTREIFPNPKLRAQKGKKRKRKHMKEKKPRSSHYHTLTKGHLNHLILADTHRPCLVNRFRLISSPSMPCVHLADMQNERSLAPAVWMR